MTTKPTPPGCFKLKRGIRLVRNPGGGVLLLPDSMRALKINRAALEILEKCRNGLWVDEKAGAGGNKSLLTFLDTFVQGGLLDWLPVPGQDLPMVSIVIPVYNRALEIEQCLTSLQSLDYPADKIEIIVVDDASRDHTADVVRRYNTRLIVQPHNLGQSAARNIGAAAAQGEIIAFLDSDCIASPAWLRDLVPYFQDPRVALVGGYVDAYYRDKRIDRYEQTCSALNMGPQSAMGRGDRCVFYVPCCNMLVRKAIYAQAGGLDETLRLGEDVDLCWRLMAAGHNLLYRPQGAVSHKHRNRFLSGFLRRFDYGTSEAVLYARFPKIKKQFPWQPGGIAVIIAAIAALATHSWLWLVPVTVLPVVETGCRRFHWVRRLGIRLSLADIFTAVVKSHGRLAYSLSFYMVRYHLLPLVVLACVLPAMTGLWLAIIVTPILVTYLRRRPRLSLPAFALFYLTEHAFYQCGALRGCFKQRNFRLYRITFRYAGFSGRSKPSVKRRPMAAKQPAKEAVIG